MLCSYFAVIPSHRIIKTGKKSAISFNYLCDCTSDESRSLSRPAKIIICHFSSHLIRVLVVGKVVG